MKKLMILIGLLVSVLQGCATDRIATMANETRNDVFVTVKEGGGVPEVGTAELDIECSFKAPKRVAPEEPMLLLNIDGQVLKLPARTGRETASSTTYSLAAKLSLRSGPHRVFIALPEEGAYEDRNIVLQEGSRNRLLLIPLYRRRTLNTTHGVDSYSFEEGVRGFEVFLNRDEI